MDVVGLILAAGESRRMGTPKMLLEIAGVTMLDVILERLSRSCMKIVVVVPEEFYKEDEGIRAMYEKKHGPCVEFIPNPNRMLGMHTSFILGIRHALSVVMNMSGVSETPFLLLMQPMDMPLISELTDRALLEAASLSTALEQETSYMVPSHSGKAGHPICIPSSICRTIINRQGDSIRALLSGYERKYVEVSDAGVLIDIDTPEDYETYILKRTENEPREVLPHENSR